jgi:hypothetical protein
MVRVFISIITVFTGLYMQDEAQGSKAEVESGSLAGKETGISS